MEFTINRKAFLTALDQAAKAQSPLQEILKMILWRGGSSSSGGSSDRYKSRTDDTVARFCRIIYRKTGKMPDSSCYKEFSCQDGR